ncbi:hypothetical protein [Bifidobacterium simiarum]|uniref:hypothetical protein n=1 Tax=Bifidobacterium simiarum TaxID=2045441 RepID=UPI001BDCBA14|nr:hypothetical protein [Bifidobacterium simiarum]MBT1167176.1 hypothetical protein [Bifidobacterium simiarum]
MISTILKSRISDSDGEHCKNQVFALRSIKYQQISMEQDEKSKIDGVLHRTETEQARKSKENPAEAG